MDPQCSESLKMSSNLLAFAAGFLSAIFAEPIRRWIYRPVLKLDFKNNDHFVPTTPEGDPPDHRARFVRLRATNVKNGVAKGCRAYLIGLDRRGPSGTWDPTEYCDNLQLGWSCEKSDALDLPRDVPRFVTVLSTRETSKEFHPHLPIVTYTMQRLLAEIGTYRLTVLVTGDGVKPARMSLSFKWTGVWDQFEVSTV